MFTSVRFERALFAGYLPQTYKRFVQGMVVHEISFSAYVASAGLGLGWIWIRARVRARTRARARVRVRVRVLVLSVDAALPCPIASGHKCCGETH